MTNRGRPADEPVPGTVYLVGAGPGDPGLLTVRALQLLARAEVVLHDRLVSAEVLALCDPSAELIAVGKTGHGPQISQPYIDAQLIAQALRGRRVVRLKGGDPLLFGRGTDEAAALRAAGVPFEIVPGLSAALAVPAAAGIPLTARGIAASVAIVTGHCAGGGTPALPTADTLVVLMGVSSAAGIRDQLLASGRSPATPAAVIQWGTWETERMAIGTLATLPELIAREGLGPPAVVVIGESVRLREQLSPTAAVGAMPGSEGRAAGPGSV